MRLLLPALLSSILALSAAAADYVVDPSHTYATFEIDHMGFSTQRGLFRQTSGQIRYDPEARSGEIEIRIDAASLDTGFGLRDDVLRGADWFNVKDFPDIIFRSQPQWAAGADPIAELAKPLRIAGLGETEIKSCLANDAMLNAVLNDYRSGEALGVSATPTLFIGGQLYRGSRSVEDIDAALVKLVK